MSLLDRTWAEISLDNAIHNYNLIKQKVGKDIKICCVIKADGYGHGAVSLAKMYEKSGADFFAVSNIDEGIELRNSGITKPILILGFTPALRAKQLEQYDISQSVYSLEYAKKLINQCQKDKIKCKVHIKVDTGMTRLGFMCQKFPRDEKTVDEIYKVCKSKVFKTEGIFTHFCVSDEDIDGKEFTKSQYSNFNYVVKSLNKKGINFDIIHTSNSAALEDYPQTYCDMVRAGIILYGLSPSEKLIERLDLRPVMTLKTTVALVKEIKEGTTIGYGRTFKAEKQMKIATVPIGYADGFIRAYKDGYMMVSGKKAKILGRISMDQTVIDVSKIDNVNIGDEVTVFGTGKNGEMTADDLAKMANTINYEVVCLISKRVPRIIIKNGKKIDVVYKL